MRKTIFQNDYYYHVYNRGADKRNVFGDSWDYVRFLKGMREFNRLETIGDLYSRDCLNKNVGQEARIPAGSLASKQPLVKIICYALLTNHYHIILKQQSDNGIVKFMQKLGTGYAKYFNFKYKRSGVLFQGPYKSIPIKTNEYLLRLSAYIHGNPEIHKIKKAIEWQWSSYQDYLELRDGTMCDKNNIISQFKNVNEYQKYVNIVIEESKLLKNEIEE